MRSFRIHPFTTVSIVCIAAAIFLHGTERDAFALLLLVIAYALILFEFKKITSLFQFTMIIICALCIGIMIDDIAGSAPFYTAASLCVGLATIARQAWMHVFTYVRLLWVEPLLLLLAVGMMVIGAHQFPASRDLLAVPMLPFIAATVLAIGYVQDGLRITSQMGHGYQVKIGSKAKDFALADQLGQMVKLSDQYTNFPVLLVFVRGDWCPGCHMMLRTYERRREEFLKRGVHVLGIGPDDISINKEMVSKIGIGYKLLSDPDQKVSDQYGVVYNNPLIEAGLDYKQGIPLPASFLIDTDGVVRYVSRPDRVGEFLSPALIFDKLSLLPLQD